MTDSRKHYEVIVVGAGPAGVAAAIRLSELGIECLVLEKASGKRVKQCGGAVSPCAVRLYQKLGLPEEYFQQKGFGTDQGLICGFGVELRGQTSRGQYGYFVERRELDWDFQQLAIDRYKVQLVYGSEVVDFSVVNEQIWVEVRHGSELRSYSSRYLVAADGATSRIRTRLSGRKIRARDMILTSSAILRSAEDKKPMIQFYEDRMPTYSWAFPYRGSRVNLGIGMYANLYELVRSRAELERLMARITDIALENRLSKWVINTNPFERRTFAGRIFLAGDAGGLVDALTGEGIPFALLSGIASANAVGMMQWFGRVAATFYSVSLIPAIVRLTASKALQSLLGKFPAVAGFVLQCCRRNDAARWVVIKYFSHS